MPGGINSTRFRDVPPLLAPSPAAQPRRYRSDLTPRTSQLRPHCLARERLLLWVPGVVRSCLDHTGAQVAVTDSDLDRILVVIAHSHAPSTRETYGSGLLVFHVFCDEQNIPEHQRCPASSVVVLAFIASCAGMYSGKTLENYLYGIRAWHLLHGQEWLVN